MIDPKERNEWYCTDDRPDNSGGRLIWPDTDEKYFEDDTEYIPLEEGDE